MSCEQDQADVVRIAEKIYACKEEKKALELQLSEEKFRYQYISMRREMVRHGILLRLELILVIALFMMWTLSADSAPFWMFFDLYLLIAEVMLLWGTSKRLWLLIASRDTEAAARFSEKHHLDTFQRQQRDCEGKISLLEFQIARLESEMADLNLKKRELLEKKEQGEDVLHKNSVLPDENPAKEKAKFNLRKENTGSQDMFQLHEYYLREEQYINEHLIQLDGKLQRVNKEMMEIDENFEMVKKKLLISVLIFIIVILMQSAFTGISAVITSCICFVGGLIYIFYLESKCSKPILLYLVEHDSNLTREYAFCNNVVPVKNRRVELLEEIENEKKELAEIREKREAIIF